MLIGLLVLLGVDIIVIVAFVVFVLGRRRWVKRQPGAFAGAIRVTEGAVDGLGPKWKRGYGRWVRDVLVWTKAPLLMQNELVPVDRIASERKASQGEVKHLGDAPVVVEFDSDTAKVEVAGHAEHTPLVTGSAVPVTTPDR